MFSDEDRTVDKSDPDQRNGNNLDSQRNCLMFHEVADIHAQFRMIHQPAIQSCIAAEKQGCRKQEKRCSREDRKKDAEDS